MTRVGFAVAVISAIVAVALQEVIKESCASAQAQTQTASPEPTVWDHNGSVMYLVANGSSREIYYQKPRPGMLEAGARPGSLLFRGEINNGQYLGTAYIFNLHCGPIPFDVKGPILHDDERIVLTGQAPRVGQNCRTHGGSYPSTLEFRRSKPNEVAQSQEPLPAAQVDGEPKAELPSTNGDERPSAPAAQSSVKSEMAAGAKGSSVGVAEPKPLSTPTGTSGMPGANDLDKYKWGAAVIVMIAWLLVVSFGKFLIRKTG